MTGPTFLLLCLALAVAAIDWVAVARGARPVEYLCKPLALVLLLAAALVLEPVDEAVRWWFVAALVLSLVGDVLLMVPRDLFVGGLVAFLLGHVAYVVGMHVDGVTAVPFLAGIVVVALAMAVLGTRILRGVRSGEHPELAGPVVAYMGIISAMVASAVGTGSVAFVIGAVLFYGSDALIAWNRFVAPVRHGPVLIMVTYHLGQAGLVLGLL